MNLSFLGVGSAYNPAMKSTSAYSIFDRTLLLLDCGETVFESLRERKLFDNINNIFLVVTHFHSDHIGSIGSMISYCYCALHKKIFLYYPTSDICSLLTLTGVPSEMYTYCDSVPDSMSFAISPIEVEHDPMLKCYGYIIKDQESSVFYGGDSVSIEGSILSMLRSGELSHIYQDTTYEHAVASSCHGSLDRLAQEVEPEYRSKVTCMHFGEDFTDKVSELGFNPARILP